jgi:translation initiation factor 5B
MPSAELRQILVATLGHVDHGKTSLLDAIRGTKVQSREAGEITQHVGASEVPIEVVKKVCAPVLSRMPVRFTIPGLLLIDTPGHEVFANLRRRGGSIADIAMLVVDITKGIEAQTVESLEILREYKVPFVIAANKVDLLTGWRPAEGAAIGESLAAQRPDVQARVDELLYRMVGQLYERKFNGERFDRVTDLTKQVVIVPVSARTREGLPELLLYLSGLAQKYLEERLRVSRDISGKASILEVKEEKGLGKTLDVILYDGSLQTGDTVVFATKTGVAASKVKALLKPAPLQEMRAPTEKFKSVKEVQAASGVKLACDRAEEALPGSPLYVARTEDESAKAQELVAGEVKEIVFESEQTGVIVRADALGSLEAITKLFSAEGIAVRSAIIGSPSKRDVMEASSVREREKGLGALFAFNVPVDAEVRRAAEEVQVKLFEERIIYNLVEGYQRWRQEEREREKREAFTTLTLPARVRVLPGFMFRMSNPAIFGIEVEVGVIRKEYELMNEEGVVVGTLKAIQREKQSVESAKRGEQVAVSMPEPAYGRQVLEKQALYTAVPKEHARTLEEKYASALSPEELELLRQIKKIRGFTVF